MTRPTIFDLAPSSLRSMTGKESEMLVALSFIPEETGLRKPTSAKTTDWAKLLDPEGTNALPFLLRIITQRWHMCEVDFMVDPRLAIMAAGLSDRPGIAVMWAHAIYVWAVQHDGLITLEQWAGDIHPLGVPADEGYKSIWDDQKDCVSPLGNWLDSKDAWANPVQPVAA